jgi:hypothetical protein
MIPSLFLYSSAYRLLMQPVLESGFPARSVDFKRGLPGETSPCGRQSTPDRHVNSPTSTIKPTAHGPRVRSPLRPFHDCSDLRVTVVRRFPSLRSSLRSSSTASDNHQPLIVRRPSVQSQSTNYSQSHASKCSTALSQSENLLPIEEEERDKPTFDRSVDLVAIAAPHKISIDQTEVFEQLVSAYDEQNGEHRLSALPAAVRHRIYAFCFEGFERRKINLSPKFAVRAVFPDSHFLSPWNVLDPVFGGVHAFRALRHDLMTYFWTTYHFHVTLNVFSGPVFSPLSHIWLLNFLDRIQRLTIEVDFTRFGGSSMRLAPSFGHNNDKLEDLLLGLIRGLKERPGRLTMAELNLMCRRYGGFRTKTEELGSSTGWSILSLCQS